MGVRWGHVKWSEIWMIWSHSYYGSRGDDSVINSELQNLSGRYWFILWGFTLSRFYYSLLSKPTPLGSGDPCLYAFGEDLNSGFHTTRATREKRYSVPVVRATQCFSSLQLNVDMGTSSSNASGKHVWASDTPIIQYCGLGFRKSFWQHILTFSESSNKPHTQYPSCFNIKLSSAFLASEMGGLEVSIRFKYVHCGGQGIGET